ncbi:hypothetical protein D6V26_20085 [Vibrio cholerae]|nr:hypothetical protein [Vibrio cholerae]
MENIIIKQLQAIKYFSLIDLRKLYEKKQKAYENFLLYNNYSDNSYKKEFSKWGGKIRGNQNNFKHNAINVVLVELNDLGYFENFSAKMVEEFCKDNFEFSPNKKTLLKFVKDKDVNKSMSHCRSYNRVKDNDFHVVDLPYREVFLAELDDYDLQCRKLRSEFKIISDNFKKSL